MAAQIVADAKYVGPLRSARDWMRAEPHPWSAGQPALEGGYLARGFRALTQGPYAKAAAHRTGRPARARSAKLFVRVRQVDARVPGRGQAQAAFQWAQWLTVLGPSRNA